MNVAVYRHGLLGRREDVACGGRTRYVLRALDSEVHPSCIHGLKHFFGRSGVALRDAEPTSFDATMLFE